MIVLEKKTRPTHSVQATFFGEDSLSSSTLGCIMLFDVTVVRWSLYGETWGVCELTKKAERAEGHGH